MGNFIFRPRLHPLTLDDIHLTYDKVVLQLFNNPFMHNLFANKDIVGGNIKYFITQTFLRTEGYQQGWFTGKFYKTTCHTYAENQQTESNLSQKCLRLNRGFVTSFPDCETERPKHRKGDKRERKILHFFY